MTNVEHLIENALFATKSSKDIYKSFCEEMNDERNKCMLEEVHVTKDELWEIVQYLKYTYCPYCRDNGGNE